jgi:hypothetical protein
MLHHLSCLIRLDLVDMSHVFPCLGYLLSLLRARQFTSIDVAHLAHILGKWRGGPTRQRMKHPVVEALLIEIERYLVELMQRSQLSPRQLATAVWMFGRIKRSPQHIMFWQLCEALITEKVRAQGAYLLARCVLYLCVLHGPRQVCMKPDYL